VLLPAVRLHSIGRAGAEDLRVEREIVYHAPLSTTDEVTQRRRFTELFDNQDRWTSVSGTHAITDIDGNNALAVTGTDADKSSLTQLNLPADANIDFGRAGRGTGGYLSYDAQVKVGLEPNSPLPYFSAGLAFRLRRLAEEVYMYGLGFTHAGQNVGFPGNDVPSEIMNHRAIVLWQQTGGGANRRWMAYKKMMDNVDVITETHSGVTLYKGALPINDSTTLRFTFDCPVGTNCSELRVDFNNGTPPKVIPLPVVEEPITCNLGKLAEGEIQFQFYYTASGIEHTAGSSTIKDVVLEADWPLQNSTLAVRLQEAAALTFNNGGTQEIAKGDWVIGASSGARGRVAFAPILNGTGTWSGGNALGVLLLNRVTGIFSTGEPINVIGKGEIAVVDSFDSETIDIEKNTDYKVNFIQAYFGRAGGTYDGDVNRFNADMRPNPRLASAAQLLTWPPDDGESWRADRDYFRLIEWDAINDANVTNLAFVPWQVDGGGHNQAIIRSHQPKLQTDLSQTELLGLYAFGDGATNVYFDDFGLQIDMPVRSPFPTPLQQ
jgi:hypothetical protein